MSCFRLYEAFKQGAIDALIRASNADPFVVHALAYETVQRANRQLLRESTEMPPLTEASQSRRLTLAQVEAALVDKEAVVQTAYDEYEDHSKAGQIDYLVAITFTLASNQLASLWNGFVSHGLIH